MPEKFTEAERSRIMTAVKSRDTIPELIVRRLVHRLGYRFRLHCRDLPGTPDIVLPKLRKVINVHGCFWHRHNCPHGRIDPVKNADYWVQKRKRNALRDRVSLKSLRVSGWKVMTVWECEIKQRGRLLHRLVRFLTR